MPIARPSSKSLAWQTCLVTGLLLFSSSLTFARTEPVIAVVRNIAWSPADAQREGACEFEVFLTVAQLKQHHREVGLVGVGNHNGRLSTPAERALEHMALRGIPIAKIAAAGGSVAHDSDALFVNAGSLPETAACSLLQQCIQRYGPPPAATDPRHPTPVELNTIRRHLQQYQEAFTTAASTTPAAG